MKLIITGSRTWDRPDVVHLALDGRLMETRDHRSPSNELTVIWGRADQGADDAVTQWCRLHDQESDVILAPRDADWHHCPGEPFCRIPLDTHKRLGYCPRAGHYRNQLMVDDRPDFGLVFMAALGRKESPGTKDCLKRIEKAGIPHVLYELGLGGIINVSAGYGS